MTNLGAPTNHDALARAYETLIRNEGIADGCALENLACGDLTSRQRRILSAFVTLWDECDAVSVYWSVGDIVECGGGLQMIVVSVHGSRAVLYDATPQGFSEGDGPFIPAESSAPGGDWCIIGDDESGFATYQEALAVVTESGQ